MNEIYTSKDSSIIIALRQSEGEMEILWLDTRNALGNQKILDFRSNYTHLLEFSGTLADILAPGKTQLSDAEVFDVCMQAVQNEIVLKHMKASHSESQAQRLQKSSSEENLFLQSVQMIESNKNSKKL